MSGEKLDLELALLIVEAMREGKPVTFDPALARLGKLIAEAAHPVLYKRWRALHGRPGMAGVGEEVQAWVDSGMDPTDARRLVKARRAKLGIQLKMSSIAASHRRFLATTNKPAMFYRMAPGPKSDR